MPVRVEQNSDPALVEAPLIIGGLPWDDDRVLDCCVQAAAAGVYPGMHLAQAEKFCPQASFLPAQEKIYRAVHDALLTAVSRFSPAVETAGLGLVYADVAGLERSVGSDAKLVQALLAEIQSRSGLAAQIGLATNKFAAQQAACAARLGCGVIIPAGEERAFLSPLLLNTLPLDPEMYRRLTLLGVNTLGELATLPRAAVVRQFGPHAGPLHSLALGLDPRPVQADAPPTAVTLRRVLDTPISLQMILFAYLREMAVEMASTLEGLGYQAEGVRVCLAMGKETISSGMPVKTPSSEAEKLARLAKQLMERLSPQLPVSELSLVTYPLRPAHLGAVQLALFEGAHDQRRDRLHETLRGLRTRFGELVVVVASLIGQPSARRIQVTIGSESLPRALVWEDQLLPVVAIYESWRERRRWWGRPVLRDYFRLETADGLPRLIYQDLKREQWFLERRPL